LPISAQDVLIIAVTLLLIGLDVAIRYLQVLLHDQWDWAKAGQFVGSHVLPKIGGLLVTAITQYLAANNVSAASFWGSLATGASTALFWGAAAAVDVSLVRDILGKLQSLGIVTGKGGTTTSASGGSGTGAA